MAAWNKKRDPEPEKRDAQRFKDFIRAKYVEKRFAEAVDASDSSESEEARQVRKAKKKSRKEKLRKKAQSSDSEDSPLEAPLPKPEAKKESRRLGAPPGSKTAFAPVAQPPPETKPTDSLLEFGFSSVPPA